VRSTALLPQNGHGAVLLTGATASALETVARVLAGARGRELWLSAPPGLGDPPSGRGIAWVQLLRDADLAGALVACDLAPENDPDPVEIARRLEHAVAAAAKSSGQLLVCLPDDDLVPSSMGRDLTVLPLRRLPATVGTWFAEARFAQEAIPEAADLARHVVAPLGVGPGQVEAVVDAARRGVLDDEARVVELAEALRPRLGNLVERVHRRVKWDALIVPDELKQRLQEMVLYRRHADRVYTEWGMRKHVMAEGVAALFSGPPGTGKTLAASVIATELGIALYRIDLSRIVSKWVGETEKNLGRLFAEARSGRAVLLFDEADALFGKRTEVKSSVDRYANLEVNFLLQKFDEFDGIAILTTNQHSGIDDAFMRRLQFRVLFDSPDEEARAKLWRLHLPADAHLGEVDVAALGERFDFSGGNIRNAAIRAAFLAAEEGALIEQRHLEVACQTELEELGRVVRS
jgi:AAA+ superfamily predicted ATPase